MIEVRDLTVGFRTGERRLPVLRGVDLVLREGEVVVLLGESGSGKSVTAKSVLGLNDPRAEVAGTVRLDGKDLLALTPRELGDLRGRQIAFVPQDPSAALDPLRRIGKQIDEVLRRHLGLGRAQRRERIRTLLEDVGLRDSDRVARSFPHQLSGGMRQRAMIAIAIAAEPSVVIADEPTTALDVTVQAQILRLFTRLTKEHDLGLLLITHDVGVAREIADRVCVMYAGRVVEAGATAGTLDAPLHPYTGGLLESIPKPGRGRGTLSVIEGQPPIPGELPPGCPFEPRCPLSRPSCSAAEPDLIAAGDRRVACPVVVESPAAARSGRG